MDIKIENGKIIFSENNIKYSFDAHGEYPRPSIMPAISVGGKHLSNRSEDIKIEKHTAVQDIAIGNNMAAWYTQEFLPDGADYKLSKKASIYIGDFSTGKEKLIYKGECYGDLCFYENDLFFQYRQQSCCISLKQRRIRSIVQAFRHQEKRHRLAYYAKAYLFSALDT